MTGVMLDLRKNFPAIDKSETLRRWLVSTAPIGAIIGAVLAVFLNDSYGRKESLKASNFFYVLGTIIIIVSQHHSLLFLGRFIEGVGIGLITVTCPIYIAEGSQPTDRGRLVIVFVLMLPVGRFFAGVATSNLKEVRIIIIRCISCNLLNVQKIQFFFLLLLLEHSSRTIAFFQQFHH